ncbi:hypothetical protein ACN47E_010284 [Coniothyrium glycines]
MARHPNPVNRPFVHEDSKSGRIFRFHAGIKSRDIEDAIACISRTSLTYTISSTNVTDNLFLRIPAELRNSIYEFVLGVGTDISPTTQVACRVGLPDLAASKTVFQLCRHISLEARYVMQRTNIAYVPILPGMDFAALINDVLQRGPKALLPTQATILSALIRFKKVHIHCHTNHWPSKDPDDEEPFIDASALLMIARLRQAVLVFTCASTLNFDKTTRRTCIIHLDHLWSDWRHMNHSACRYGLQHLLRVMERDKNTTWELRYYVFTGNLERDSRWPEWDDFLVKEYQSLYGTCSKFSNVKLIPEVYGEMRWSQEGEIAEVTRRITPSSTLWPSWPENVPWRMFPMVRSDQPVLADEGQ